MNTLLRVLLLIWVIGYLVVACGPLLDGQLVVGTILALTGVVFFIPWVIGIVILVFLIKGTNERR